MFQYAMIALAGFSLLYTLHRSLRWMEDRGWIYYWRKNGSGSFGNAFVPLQQLVQPEVRHFLDEKTDLATEAEQDFSGEPPDWTNPTMRGHNE